MRKPQAEPGVSYDATGQSAGPGARVLGGIPHDCGTCAAGPADYRESCSALRCRSRLLP